MDTHQINSILEKIKTVKIAVYGDFCLDAYWLMDKQKSEISIETGLQAESIERHYYSPGGAANVVSNLAALNPAKIGVIGVVGNDIHGRELTAQLQALGTDTSRLFVQQENFQTYTYLKRYTEGAEEPRIDFGVRNQRSQEIDTLILESIDSALKEYDAVIFNQQVVGSITNDSFIDRANALFKQYNDKIVLVDSRHFNHRFFNVHRKVNDVEAAHLNGIEASHRSALPRADVLKYGKNLFHQSQKPVFITCGESGIVAFEKTGFYEFPALQLSTQLDTVGAGDTAISAITLCLAAGILPKAAAQFANFAAAVTVQKLFTTGTANGEEIVQISLCHANEGSIPHMGS